LATRVDRGGADGVVSAVAGELVTFGPEYDFVILLLVVLACLAALATLQWWLGVAGIAAVLIALGVAMVRGG